MRNRNGEFIDELEADVHCRYPLHEQDMEELKKCVEKIECGAMRKRDKKYIQNKIEKEEEKLFPMRMMKEHFCLAPEKINDIDEYESKCDSDKPRSISLDIQEKFAEQAEVENFNKGYNSKTA